MSRRSWEEVKSGQTQRCIFLFVFRVGQSGQKYIDPPKEEISSEKHTYPGEHFCESTQ